VGDGIVAGGADGGRGDPGAILMDRERDVRARLVTNAELARPPSLDQEIGRLTRQDALQQQQMALHARRRLELQLAQIRGALSRVAEGTFGACALCGIAIAPARLELVPETPFCVACAERLE